MNLYWTSLKPINGLRHFVCVNEMKEEGKWKMLLVSVIDIEVNLMVSKNELENSGLWNLGWIELNDSESITHDYISFKMRSKVSDPVKISLNDSSPFKLF
tara:strand:- start:124 stop:423 length:300 start_codon:yes stop_codon:yes gene_type:complete